MRAGNGRPNMFYAYVLLSIKDNELYIGWTNDLKVRLITHNSGQVLATKNRMPLKLIYYEACLQKESAIAREINSKPAMVELI